MRLDTWSGLFVWFMIFEIQTVLATWSKYCTPFTKSLGPHPRGICGNQINEMLSLLCYMGYNRRKRDVGQDNNIIKGNDIFIRREEANSYLVKRSAYYDQGIVCECCYHRCNLRELLSYCRNDAAARFGLFKRSVENSLSNSRRHKQIDTDQSSND